MSWKFGGVYIKPGFENPEEALRFLGIDKRFTYETIKFSDAVAGTFIETAIGSINGVTLVHDNLLPYNNSYEADTFTDADFNMRELSKNSEIISFFLDSITESYGLNHFKNGQRCRRYSFMNRNLIMKEGNFTKGKKRSEEDNMLHWLQEFTGISFNELLNNESLKMYLFTETGF